MTTPLPPPQPRTLPAAPAADHAHLCDHAPDALGSTQGCPSWPACLSPGTVLHLPADETLSERERVAQLFGVPVEFVTPLPRTMPPAARRSFLAHLAAMWHG